MLRHDTQRSTRLRFASRLTATQRYHYDRFSRRSAALRHSSLRLTSQSNANMTTSRSVPEWIGKTPDTPAPPRVRIRVFERHGGKCHISGIKILAGDEWDMEHIKPLHRGGENRESNLAPALRQAHREKTKLEMADKAKADRIRAKHLGVYPKSRNPIRSRGFAKHQPMTDPDT